MYCFYNDEDTLYKKNALISTSRLVFGRKSDLICIIDWGEGEGL